MYWPLTKDFIKGRVSNALFYFSESCLYCEAFERLHGCAEAELVQNLPAGPSRLRLKVQPIRRFYKWFMLISLRSDSNKTNGVHRRTFFYDFTHENLGNSGHCNHNILWSRVSSYSLHNLRNQKTVINN